MRKQQNLGHPDIKATLAARLKIARKASHLTLEQVGHRLSITKQRMSQFETGNNLPGLLNLIALAETYNVSLDYLVGRVEAPEELMNMSPALLNPIITVAEDAVIKSQTDIATRKLNCANNNVQRAIDAMELIKETLAKVAEMTPDLLSQIDLT